MKSSFNGKLNNYGYTLVELIVVIAIMSILAGGAALGLSLIFSKDAAKCATRLNDALYETRMNSMSRSGKYKVKVDASGACNVATISCTGVTPAVADKQIYLDDTDTSKKTAVTAKFVTESDPDGQPVSLPVSIEFDKAKGNAKIDGITDDGILVFDIVANRGGRTSKVQLVTTTGKHTVGEFE